MVRFLVFLLVILAPYIALSLPGVPQASGRTVFVAVFLVGAPVATLWFGFKSQMIRPGAKLYQPQFASVRPQIERKIRILVFAFAAFFIYLLTLPFTEDLVRWARGREPMRIIQEVTHESAGFRSPWLSVGLSHGARNYYLFYGTKPLQLGHRYEFVVLPQSRLILDYWPD